MNDLSIGRAADQVRAQRPDLGRFRLEPLYNRNSGELLEYRRRRNIFSVASKCAIPREEVPKQRRFLRGSPDAFHPLFLPFIQNLLRG